MSSPRPKRLLMTGGRGRLAPLIADHFSSASYAPELFSRSPDTGLRILRDLPDISFTPEDTILHLAWSTLPATSEQNPGSEERNDLPWLDHLLASLVRRPAAERPFLIFFSSGGTVYGNAPGRPNRETDACAPIGRYGRAKLDAEERIESARKAGVASAILRISNPYGYPVPGGRPQGVIPHAIRAAVEGRPLTLWGDGTAGKDFIYYTDFLAALEQVINRRLEGIYNVAAGVSHRIADVISRVEHHTHRPVAIDPRPAPPWDVHDSRLDPTRLTEATGWRPRIALDEGIRRSVAGYLDH